MSRFTTFSATYRIVTPMFCGGAGQEAELRLSSFKGALRFWWRTLQWGKVKNERELWKKEAELFGSSDQGYGQSKVRMRLDGEPSLEPTLRVGDVFQGGKLLGAHYLGYGVMEAFSSQKSGKKAGQLTREMIPGGSFTVAFRCGPNLDESQLEEIQKTLILVGTTGGLGSKSRKGYGSLTLTQLKIDGSPVEMNHDPKERLKRALGTHPNGQPDWTAWSSQSRVVTVTGESDPLRLLDKLGRELVFFRSWGRDGKVLGQNHEKNFVEDHDLSKGQRVGIAHPKRVVFGLPHNYGKGNSNSVAPKKLDRRASPLFFHIHQDSPKSTPVAVVSFLPSLFLPDGEQLSSFDDTVNLDRSENFWQPVHGYLDRLLGKPGATKKRETNLKAEEVPLV